jgi:hypothetical protein
MVKSSIGLVCDGTDVGEEITADGAGMLTGLR